MTLEQIEVYIKTYEKYVEQEKDDEKKKELEDTLKGLMARRSQLLGY